VLVQSREPTMKAAAAAAAARERETRLYPRRTPQNTQNRRGDDCYLNKYAELVRGTKPEKRLLCRESVRRAHKGKGGDRCWRAAKLSLCPRPLPRPVRSVKRNPTSTSLRPDPSPRPITVIVCVCVYRVRIAFL